MRYSARMPRAHARSSHQRSARSRDALDTDAQRWATCVLEGALRGRGWQGPTLTGALRGVTPREALTPPAVGRKCIWEHVLHAAYWKYAILRALVAPAEPEPFPRGPAGWPALPEGVRAGSGIAARDAKAAARAWRADVALLTMMHERVLAAVQNLPAERWHTTPPSSPGSPGSPKRQWTYAQYIAGAAAHDQYHCGQVQLIKRLVRGSRGYSPAMDG